MAEPGGRVIAVVAAADFAKEKERKRVRELRRDERGERGRENSPAKSGPGVVSTPS